MQNRLLIDVVRMKPEGEVFEGEADIIGIEESLVHPFGGVRYRLKAQLFGKELLVRGHLEQDFDLVCSRCGKDFDTTVNVEDWTVSVELTGKEEFADITEEVREAVLLELPNYPVCDEACEGVAQAQTAQGDARWGALEGLKIS